MEDFQHEILRVPRPGTGPIAHKLSQPRDKCNTEGIPAAEDGGGGIGDRYDLGFGPTPPQGNLAPDEGVVQGCGLSRAATRSSKPPEDQGGARCAVLSIKNPGGKHPLIVEIIDIFSLKWRYYGPKRGFLDYWGTHIFCLLSYYILSMDKGLKGLKNGYM